MKAKGILSGSLCLLAICFFAIGLFVAASGRGAATAYAATTPKYSVSFDYTANYNYGTGSGTLQYPSSGNGVYNASFWYGANKTSNSVSVSMYGSSASGTENFSSGSYFPSTDVTIVVNSGVNLTTTIINSNGGQVGSGTNRASASGLKEGTYTVKMYGSGAGMINSRAGWKYDFTGTFQFKIDQTAPIISGASASATGKYINASFAVAAKDSASGVKTLYVKAPNSGSFYSTSSSSTTVNKGSANGLYTFYAEDNAGNKSAYHYVNFDDTAPVMECTGTNFGLSTNAPFMVTATDNSGSVTLYYKFNDGEWKASGNKYSLQSTADDGSYSFYAQDNYGNKTNVKTIQVGADLYGEFVKSDKDNSVYFTWDRSNWTATLDGKSYTKGTWIRSEGEHIIKLCSGTKNAVYPYTIGHYYVEKLVDATCTESGYIEYNCVQCGNAYSVAVAEETGHYYVASTVAPTCTEGGYTTYTCTRCGDSYRDNVSKPLGHNYETAKVPASCCEGGKTVFHCQVCGYERSESDGTLPTGHDYTNHIVREATCTEEGMRKSVCDACGYSFETSIPASGHNYIISDAHTSNGNERRSYTCSVCGNSYTQELGNRYDEVANYVEYLFEQYRPYMIWVFLATAGVWSIAIGVAIIIAHKNEDKEKAKKMLINYVIGLVVIFTILVACPYLVKGIATLVT